MSGRAAYDFEGTKPGDLKARKGSFPFSIPFFHPFTMHFSLSKHEPYPKEKNCQWNMTICSRLSTERNNGYTLKTLKQESLDISPSRTWRFFSILFFNTIPCSLMFLFLFFLFLPPPPPPPPPPFLSSSSLPASLSLFLFLQGYDIKKHSSLCVTCGGATNTFSRGYPCCSASCQVGPPTEVLTTLQFPKEKEETEGKKKKSTPSLSRIWQKPQGMEEVKKRPTITHASPTSPCPPAALGPAVIPQALTPERVTPSSPTVDLSPSLNYFFLFPYLLPLLVLEMTKKKKMVNRNRRKTAHGWLYFKTTQNLLQNSKDLDRMKKNTTECFMTFGI